MRIAMLITGLAIGLGCGTPPKRTQRPPPPPHVPVDPPRVAALPVSNAIVKTIAPRAMIESPHAGAIKTLGVTADGTAALSCDDLDGYRLWPTLDGTTEPRVVDLPRAKTIALARQGDEFLVAIVDDVGGLVLAVLAADGSTKQRVSIAPEPGFAGVVMTAQGAIAWRVDHSIVQLDRSGRIVAHLAVAAGQRLVTITRTGDQAIAIVETATGTSTTRRARRLAIGATLAWGDMIELADDLGPVVALSPSGKRLATLVVDRTTNVQRTLVFTLDTSGKLPGKLIVNRATRNALQLGFIDEDNLAIVQPAALEWVDITKAERVEELGPTFEAFVPPVRQPFGVGPGVVIAPRNDELALATPTGTKYLGYGLESPAVAAVGGTGRVLVGLGETFALLDRDLREIGAPQGLVPKGSMVAEVHWLGGDDWLVETSNPNDGKSTIAITDLAKGARTELRTNIPVAQFLRYEPTTKLVTLSAGEAPEVARYDADKRTLTKLVTLARPNGFEQRQLAPVAPSLAAGAQLVSIQNRDRMTLRWITQLAAVDSGPSIAVDGSLAAIDRAGHVYAWQNGADHKLSLAVFAAGKQIGTLPTEGTTTVWPDPTGTQVIQLTGREIVLLALDGTRKWSVPLVGAIEALWLDDGTLAITSGIGIVKLDVATGAIRATRCGWRFGLSATPHPFINRLEPLCVQGR